MFKFMKSKKGFTLVELMIVVVIMAILVAVAVPIFSAVTENARAKTCVGNQREIISSVGNWLMLKDSSSISGSFQTTGGQEAPDATAFTGDIDEDDVASLFKTIPVCPDSENYIQVTINPGSDGGKATVTTSCSSGDAKHKVPGTN